jgi:phosphate transport system permease protein
MAITNYSERTLGAWLRSGTPWIWLTAGTVSFCLIMVFGLLLLITLRGMGHFWPQDVARLALHDSSAGTSFALGQIVDRETVTAARVEALGISVPAGQDFVERYLLKIGNRDITGLDFKWFSEAQFSGLDYPPDVIVVEREEWGNFYGSALTLKRDDVAIAAEHNLWEAIADSLERARALKGRIEHIERRVMGDINFRLERLRLRARGLDLQGATSDDPRYLEIANERSTLEREYASHGDALAALYQDLRRDVLVAQTIEGMKIDLPFASLVRVFAPNRMGVTAKIGHYFAKIGEFVSDDPREANTEGGVFPAIFGTVLMVLLMSVFVTPFGVIAAVYLHEYAHQGVLTRIIRIAVNNLAGVPSVVYGVFGLGFFVYFAGGSIDQLFFPAALPAPTFGTPGMLWSSLTLALLTVPVVIVATEEGLSRVPRSIREGSLALGATKAETLLRTVLPMASPAMMTGLILAVARAAGEVAPLMMVGVVKLAPALPLDASFPFLHLDRKFMHLGFHIYDVGFQSPNVEAARPLVYATSLLLVVIIVSLNLAAITIRNRLRVKYNASDT